MNAEMHAASEGATALALCVIQQAMRDATAERTDQQALAFLTETSGPWAAAFEAWCAVADVHPDWARERCRMAMLEMISSIKAKRRPA